jgi:AcrR family transcriptional regulator
MPFDPHGTRQRIFDAAVDEFSAHGSAGARVDRIAERAQANKESIYRYYGTKDELLTRVLDEVLDERGEEMLPGTDDLPRYVAESVAHFAAHPEFPRLHTWEGLEGDGTLDPATTERRRAHYERKAADIAAQQREGRVDPALDPRLLMLVLHSLSGYWFTQPQTVELTLGHRPQPDDLEAYEAFLAECVRRIVTPPTPSPAVP